VLTLRAGSPIATEAGLLWPRSTGLRATCAGEAAAQAGIKRVYCERAAVGAAFKAIAAREN